MIFSFSCVEHARRKYPIKFSLLCVRVYLNSSIDIITYDQLKEKIKGVIKLASCIFGFVKPTNKATSDLFLLHKSKKRRGKPENASRRERIVEILREKV